MHDKGMLISFGWMYITKEKKNQLLTVVVPQLRCLNTAGAGPGRTWVVQTGKALLPFGAFCLLPSVPPVTGSSVNFS